nr:hypothetical protein [Vibrio fluvialis]
MHPLTRRYIFMEINLNRGDRLKKFFSRLELAEPSTNRNSARNLIQDILDGVEDEFTNFPNDRSPLNNRMYFYSFSVQEWKNLNTDPCYISLNGVHKVFIYNNGSVVMHRTRENPSFEFFRKKGSNVKAIPIENALIDGVEVSAQSEVIHPLYKKGTILSIEKWDCGSVVAKIEFSGIGEKQLCIKDSLLSLPITHLPPSKEMDTSLFFKLVSKLKGKYNKLLKQDS